jgi:hypothetical protein
MGCSKGNLTTRTGFTQAMPLAVKAIKGAKPGPKARKVADGKGLFLEGNPNGSKWCG